jgi:hypothetical protein
MLLTELRLRIAKCCNSECGTYFLLGQWNRSYKNGTFCDKCKRRRSIKSAKDDIARGRLSAQRALYRLAGKQFAKQIRGDEGWYRNAALKEAMAEHLRRQIEKSDELVAMYPSGVTGKWIAGRENWTGINAAVQLIEKKRGAKENGTRKAR